MDLKAKKHGRCNRCQGLPIWTNELHGLAQLLKVRTLYERVFWASVIGLCLCSALWFSRVLFTAYLERQTVTLNTFKEVKRIQYPNIVICPKQADSLQYNSLRDDMNNHLKPLVSDDEFYDLLNFVIAGSGVHGMQPQLQRWEHNYTDYLYNRVNQWRFNRTWDDFFEFVFETNGYKCEDLFYNCFYGYYQIPCCEIYRPNYVLLRGRCFRLNEFYQTDSGDLGKLLMQMKELPSNLYEINGTQPQLVVYLSTKHGDVSPSPRLYINKKTWNEIWFQMKKINMMAERVQQCSNSAESMSMARCANNAWLQNQLVQPFNCTFFPFHTNLTANLTTCNPKIVIENYEWIMKSRVATTHCYPACEREDLREQKTSSSPGQSLTTNTTPYMIQIRFNELRIEIYQEIQSISVPGFISELGGQVMLYVGMSMNSVIQFFVLAFYWIRRRYRRIRVN